MAGVKCCPKIRTNAAGLIEYRAHPFWSQKYCPSHEHDGTPRCCSCERMESWNSRCAVLNDARKLCMEFLDSSIMDTNVPETRGLCLFEEQTISTARVSILRRPRLGAGNQIFGMRTEPYKLRRHCEVIEILILYGLLRLLTGSILAHEMMHSWLRLNGLLKKVSAKSSPICGWNPVVSPLLRVAKHQPQDGARSPFERKLGMFFKNQIATNTSKWF